MIDTLCVLLSLKNHYAAYIMFSAYIYFLCRIIIASILANQAISPYDSDYDILVTVVVIVVIVTSLR